MRYTSKQSFKIACSTSTQYYINFQMNDINIQIKSLGPIRDATLTIKRLMLFTGESGLGKSYLATLSNYIFALLSNGRSRLNAFFNNLDLRNLLDGKKSGEIIYTLNLSTLFEWIDRDAVDYVGYMIGNHSFDGNVHIEWPNLPNIIQLTYWESLSGLDDNEEVVYRIASLNYNFNNISDKREVDSSMFAALIRAELFTAVFGNKPLKLRNYVLPPSRGALMEIQDRPIFRSGMYEQFFRLKADLVRPSLNQKNEDILLSRLLERINDGTISQSNSEMFYTTLNGINVPLSAAASSIKEIAPLTMLLNKYEDDNISILFEEPEAHLHPNRQQFVADLIGYMISKGYHLQITTHSDYFIKRINILMKLYNILHGSEEEKYKDLCTKYGFIQESMIDANEVVAYNLVRTVEGDTKVLKLNTDAIDGIPFDSFYSVINNYFNLLDDISNIENNN